jgi:hypothetical protein
VNGTIDKASIVNNNTYYINSGVSMTHIINGMAGNIESHSTLSADERILNITAILDQEHCGFSKLTVLNATALKWSFVRGDDGSLGDELMLLKPSRSSGASTATSATTGLTTSTAINATTGLTTNLNYITTEIVTAYTTYCPFATVFTQGSQTYTVTGVSFLSWVCMFRDQQELIKGSRLPP